MKEVRKAQSMCAKYQNLHSKAVNELKEMNVHKREAKRVQFDRDKASVSLHGRNYRTSYKYNKKGNEFSSM